MNGLKKVYIVDTGNLYNFNDKDCFDIYKNVYDRRRGYCTVLSYYGPTLELAVDRALWHLDNRGQNSYSIVSEICVSTDIDIDNTPVEEESYPAKDVVFSAAKIDGKLVENFIEGQQKFSA